MEKDREGEGRGRREEGMPHLCRGDKRPCLQTSVAISMAAFNQSTCTTTLCDPWDAVPLTLETKCICDWLSFFHWEPWEAYSASPDLVTKFEGRMNG